MDQGDSTRLADSEVVDASSSGVVTGGQLTSARFGPGFAWGLAAGAVGVVAIIVAGGIAQTVIMAGATDFSGPALIAGAGQMPAVVISPVRAGGDWFSVDSSGKGVLEGWADGAFGTGDFDVPDSTGYVDVTAVGSVDGVKVKHSASIFITRKTKVFIGTKPVSADDVYRDDLVGQRKLTVEFHRLGPDLVADTIRASAEVGENPMY